MNGRCGYVVIEETRESESGALGTPNTGQNIYQKSGEKTSSTHYRESVLWSGQSLPVIPSLTCPFAANFHLH